MRASLSLTVLALSLAGCRYVGTLRPLKQDGTLMSNGNLSDPTREPPVVARRCAIACGPGTVCNEALARCEPEAGAVGSHDGGVNWLP
jgi:hypothetical protein